MHDHRTLVKTNKNIKVAANPLIGEKYAHNAAAPLTKPPKVAMPSHDKTVRKLLAWPKNSKTLRIWTPYSTAKISANDSKLAYLLRLTEFRDMNFLI